MITVKIFGGLGNQLFQYTFGQYVAKKINTRVVYDIQTNSKSKNFTSRDLDIASLFDITLSDHHQAKNKKLFNNGFLWRIKRKLTQYFPILNKKYIVQKNAHYLLKNLKDNVYYEGYWQNYSYPDVIKEYLINEISSKEKIIIREDDFMKNIRENETVAIHIRRDDYIKIKKNKKLYSICELSYYEKAVELIKQKIKNPKFLIFTQDKEWASEHFNGEEYHLVKTNTALEDMLYMKNCKHIIMANSTFSWWGAWLNQNPDKMIIAPKKWYNGKINKSIENLIPLSWIKI